MNAYQRKRLEKLAEFLKTIPPKKFDMEMWMDTNLEMTEGTADGDVPVDANVCGTAGCAMGWATTIPSFRKAGLRLFRNRTFFRDCLVSACHVALVDKKTGRRTALEFWAAADFFGISVGKAAELFSPDHYTEKQMKNPKFVSKRITNFLKQYDKREP